jgi:hypothetical protein
VASGTEQLRERLDRAGWSVTNLRENALVVRGVVKDVTRGSATKGHLIGHFTRIGDCVDGNSDDLFELGLRGPLLASARVGATKFLAEVLDTARAHEELAALEPLLAAPNFEAAMGLVEARGFTLDRSKCLEDTYDTFVWQIPARRAGEYVHVGARLVPHGCTLREEAFVNPFGQAELCRTPNAVLHVGVHTLAGAEELLGVLVGATRP